MNSNVMALKSGLLFSLLILGAIIATTCDLNAETKRSIGFTKEALDHVTFYRFRSSYVVKQTGEHIAFDYIAACAVIDTTYRDGDRSLDTLGVNPKSFIKATKDGHAIQVWTPKACGHEIQKNMIPPDLFPLATFYDDVNDMSFGWGYASQDAYDSPMAQISFDSPAKIDLATYADWEAWRAKAEADFKPVGKIRSPWGYSYEDQGFTTGIARSCLYIRNFH